jgi:cell division septation protein DedD
MKMDFEKQSYLNKQNAGTAGSLRRWLFLALIFAAIIGGGAVFLYQYRTQSGVSTAVASCIGRFKTWVAERKNHIQQGMVKIKKIAANKENDQDIHFEFYTTLPNMQVNVAELTSAGNHDSNTSASAKSQPVKPATIASSADTGIIQHESSQPVKTVKKAALNHAIINADQLEADLTSEMQQDKYVIQLGIFRNAAAAEQYRMTLSEAGFEASIVKTTAGGQDVFRVQVGPFESKEQVRIAQRQLLKKNLNGIVRKIKWED